MSFTGLPTAFAAATAGTIMSPFQTPAETAAKESLMDERRFLDRPGNGRGDRCSASGELVAGIDVPDAVLLESGAFIGSIGHGC